MYKLTTFFVIVSFALLATGCPSASSSNSLDNPTEPVELYSKEYWGEWICGSNGASWYITASGLTADRDAPQGEVTLKKQSARVIEVTEGGKKYYLYASRTANASFTGSIAKEAGAALAASGTGFSAAAGVQVKITNERNPALFATVSTNISGEFAVPEIIPGDSYKVEPEGGTAGVVTIGNSGEDIGTITLTKGVNFKTRVLPWQDEYGEHLFVNNNYNFTIEVENTGDEDCRGASYEISYPDNLIVTTDKMSDIWGTIEPGKKKTLAVKVMCAEILDAEALRKIDIKITDSSRRTWTDSVSFVFKRGVFNMNIAAAKEVNGVVIPPKGKALYFKGEDISLILPWSQDDFLVFFSGATIDTETRYSFGVGKDAPDYSGLNVTYVHEPNDTETQATEVGADNTITAYLDKNDIDFYKFNAGIIEPYRPNTRIVNWNIFADGADSTVNTTKLMLDFNFDMGGDFTADNITLSPALTKGVLVNKGGGRYELPISGDWANNTSLAVTITSPEIDTTIVSPEKTIALHRATTQWVSVTADGANSTANTTKLTFNFSVDMGAAFIANNITLSPTLTKGTLSAKGGGKYELPISGTWTNNTSVTVTVAAPTGWVMLDESEKVVDLYRSVGLYKGTGLDTAVFVGYKNLADSFSYISQNAVSNDNYFVVLGSDENLPPTTLSYGYNGNKTVGITLLGDASITLSSTGSLFTVSSGVTLTLADKIKLVGRSDNTTSLVAVGGTLIMKDEAVICGNTASMRNRTIYGGGVRVGGTFIMSGGTISNNTASTANDSASKAYGGGVYVSGTFIMSDGTISENTVSANLSPATAYGGGVCVGGGTFTMTGGNICGNTNGGSRMAYGGGVSVCVQTTGTFTMSGGTISGNTYGSWYGGGVYVENGTFNKTSAGGVIYGNNASPVSLQNKAYSDSCGHTVYNSSYKKRNTTIQANEAFSSSSGPWD